MSLVTYLSKPLIRNCWPRIINIRRWILFVFFIIGISKKLYSENFYLGLKHTEYTASLIIYCFRILNDVLKSLTHFEFGISSKYKNVLQDLPLYIADCKKNIKINFSVDSNEFIS